MKRWKSLEKKHSKNGTLPQLIQRYRKCLPRRELPVKLLKMFLGITKNWVQSIPMHPSRSFWKGKPKSTWSQNIRDQWSTRLQPAARLTQPTQATYHTFTRTPPSDILPTNCCNWSQSKSLKTETITLNLRWVFMELILLRNLIRINMDMSYICLLSIWF